ncbi:MAG: acyltransferase family protein, partial [Ktedonobacterales bacterium]
MATAPQVWHGEEEQTMDQRPGDHIHMPSRLDWHDCRSLTATSSDITAVAVAAPAESSHSLTHTHAPASGSTTQVVSQRPRAFACLDGLRGLAILLVVWCHTDFSLSGYVHTWPLEHVLGGAAATGVELFFVLSGFLLFLPFARAIMAGDNWPSVSRFYLRRALRILPGYYLLIPIFLLYLSSFSHGAALRLLSPMQALLGLTLLYDLQSDANNLITGFDGPLWTLTIEWQFYLLLPWLAYALAWLDSLFRRRMPQRNARLWGLFAGLGLLIALGVAARALGASAHYAWGYPDPSATQTHVWLGMLLSAFYGARGKYIEVFALGMLASTIYVAGVEHGGLPHRLRTPLGWSLCCLSLLGLAACIPWALQAGRLFGWEGWSNNFPPA